MPGKDEPASKQEQKKRRNGLIYQCYLISFDYMQMRGNYAPQVSTT